jgi:hypothetical protein
MVLAVNPCNAMNQEFYELYKKTAIRLGQKPESYYHFKNSYEKKNFLCSFTWKEERMKKNNELKEFFYNSTNTLDNDEEDEATPFDELLMKAQEIDETITRATLKSLLVESFKEKINFKVRFFNRNGEELVNLAIPE